MTGPIQHPSWFATIEPERPAVIVAGTDRRISYGELEHRARQVANLLLSFGCEPGDHVAVVVENRLEWFEIVWGAMRIGMLVTPINFHLAAEEAAYIVADCGASVVFASARHGEVVSELAGLGGTLEHRVAVGGDLPGFRSYEDVVSAQPASRPPTECEGNWMFYSSGTTGRPKGVMPPSVGEPIGQPTSFAMMVEGLYGGGEDTVYLSPAPLYHAAPAGWTTAVHRLGGTVVITERFDPCEILDALTAHRVTHVQFVPTHLIRLMKLPDEVRAGRDLSSLRAVIHAAAPCPPDVKRAAIEWFGPIVYEYYSGSEGAGFCAITAEEWLAHPGSVGKSFLGAIHITDDQGEELPVGESGQVWFESGSDFSYHGDPEKTAEAYNQHGWSTMGDVGHVDDDGYLYLTDRVSNMVISGGVNIYPREIEDELAMHPLVHDVAVIGVPDSDLGEATRAVVQLSEGQPSAELAEELLEFTRSRIARFKCPKTVVFVENLPRFPTGKLAKRLLPTSVLETECPLCVASDPTEETR